MAKVGTTNAMPQVTELHIACQEPNISITELSNILNKHPEAPEQADKKGRSSSHIF
jgi:hypothetical protein